jgi:hypothetical protein
MEAWVGKLVQLWATGEDEPWLGILEGWSERGVVLRYTEDLALFEASRSEQRLSPMLMLFPWWGVRYIGIDLQELEGHEEPFLKKSPSYNEEGVFGVFEEAEAVAYYDGEALYFESRDKDSGRVRFSHVTLESLRQALEEG